MHDIHKDTIARTADLPLRTTPEVTAGQQPAWEHVGDQRYCHGNRSVSGTFTSGSGPVHQACPRNNLICPVTVVLQQGILASGLWKECSRRRFSQNFRIKDNKVENLCIQPYSVKKKKKKTNVSEYCSSME